MSGSRSQPQRRADLVVVRPLDELTGRLDGRHAVGEHQLITVLLGGLRLSARRPPRRRAVGEKYR